MSAATHDVVIVGGGVIGFACAFRLAEAGADVAVIDASGAAGGQLGRGGDAGPVSNAGFGEQELLRLTVSAVADFRLLAQALDELPGESVGLRTEWNLTVAFNADDKAALARVTAYRNSLGLASRTPSGSTPAAGTLFGRPGPGEVLAPDDLSVDTVSQVGGRVTGVTTDAKGAVFRRARCCCGLARTRLD